jgi:hypothetical protein
MAKGTVTVSNFSEQPLLVHVIGNRPSGLLVASGTLNSGQTSGFLVSGYVDYKVNFITVGRGAVTATNIVPNAVVQIEINAS